MGKAIPLKPVQAGPETPIDAYGSGLQRAYNEAISRQEHDLASQDAQYQRTIERIGLSEKKDGNFAWDPNLSDSQLMQNEAQASIASADAGLGPTGAQRAHFADPGRRQLMVDAADASQANAIAQYQIKDTKLDTDTDSVMSAAQYSAKNRTATPSESMVNYYKRLNTIRSR